MDKALVEYMGRKTANAPHGNAQNITSPCICTHPDAQEEIQEKLRHNKQPRDIYYDMLDNDNIHLTAKRILKGHDIKSAMNRQKKQTTANTHIC